MSRKKKILIILHLIFAFTFFSWLLMKPYVMEVVSRKSQRALYEMVMEREALFDALSAEEKAEIEAGYVSVQKEKGPSLLSQIGRLFFVETPPFALAWIFFSLAICLLLLFHIEGARLAAWILPLLVVGYGYFLYASPPKPQPGLFPSEQYVRETYLEEQSELSGRDLLLKGWHLYLIHEWTHQTPSEDEAVFAEQVDQGLFAFNIARLKWIREGKGDEVVLAGFTSPPSVFRVLSYFVWNLLFAWLINRREKLSQSAPLSSPT